MTNIFNMVSEFHTSFNVPIRTEASVDVPEAGLRMEMLKSELIELFDAAFLSDEIEVADALADIVYILEGGALVFGTGPIEVVVYDSNNDFGNMALYLHHTFLMLNEAVSSFDVEYTRVLLSVMKSVCYFMASKYGYDLDEVLTVVHKSNMTKLGDDGKPVYLTEGPEAGKVTKGPNYVTPTEDIKAILAKVPENARP